MLFSLDDQTTSDDLALDVSGLGPWQQRVRLGKNCFSPGTWASWDIAKVLLHEFPPEWWTGKRVLDIGANSGGLSLELLRRGAHVTASEPYKPFRNQIEWWKTLLSVPDDTLTIAGEGLFDCHKLGSFDVILCLGLVYHFRHPQMVLDYVGNLDADRFVISTQTCKSDQDVMINRSEIVPQYVPEGRLAGWHPSRKLFLKMLSWAGFSNPHPIEHPSVLHDWGERPQTTTNSAYFAADRGTPVDVMAEAHRYL